MRTRGSQEAGPIYLGTSGWSYKSWDKTFYPADVPKKRQFEFYATQFTSVEINLTFYRLPTESMVAGWLDKAPPGFVFAVKGSRFITHMKKLVDVREALDRYFQRLEPLRECIGIVLWQLPPMLHLDLPRLRAFLKQLPMEYDHAIEFRHASWFVPESFDLLREFNVANVSLSSNSMPMNLEVTACNVYIRFHGLEFGAAHDYTEEELAPWADHIVAQSASGHVTYVYFNNDLNVRAPANAMLLERMIRQRQRRAQRIGRVLGGRAVFR